MKSEALCRNSGWLIALLLLTTPKLAEADNSIYGISSPGFVYNVTNLPANTVNAGNPTLNLTAGATYKFIIGTANNHPVVIATNNTAFPPLTSAYSGATPQNIFSGAITVILPATNFPPALFYRCNVHGFNGQINVLPVPTNRVVSVTVTTNIVLVSTGITNTWVLVPEFCSNLVSGAWAAVPGYTNSFANNTNTTRFSRLDPICGANVFLRVRLSPPN